MTSAAGQGLVHQYMRGIRFDGLWQYQVATPSGRKRWKLLPLDAGGTQAADPDGLRWCLTRCAAAMAQRPMQKDPDHAYIPTSSDNANEWEALFPDSEIGRFSGTDKTSMAGLAAVMERGGCALLKLALRRRPLHSGKDAASWVWVVGVELQSWSSGPHGNCSPAKPKVRAALVVSPSLSAPWASGFGARVSWEEAGPCVLGSVDGLRLQGRCTEVVTIAPKRRPVAE
jgi:hypothetical protein